MNRLIGGCLFLLLVAASGTSANAAPWCAFYDASTYNCGFYSYEQCMATIRGAGGWCARNYFEGNSGQQSGKKTRQER